MAIKQISAYPTITPGEYDERTGRYENVGIDDTGWNWDENTGKTTKIDPNFQAPSQFSLEDIKNRSGYAFDPYQDKLVADSADSSLDPSTYYNQLAKDLSEASYGQWSINGDASQYQNLIESLKEVDPKAYYTAKIDTLSRGVGHQYQSNQGARGDVVKQQLQELIPEAQKAGLTPQEISSLYGSGYSAGAQGFSQILQNQQSQGGPYTPLWEGLKFVGPGALGMYGIDSALAAGLGAGYGAATGMSTYGIGSGLGTAAELSGALASGAGSLGSGALGGAGALTTTELLGSTGFTPTAGNSFLIDPTAAYTTAGLGAESLPAGSAYENFIQELANTPMDSPIFNPAVDAASKGMSASEILSNANRVRSGVNTLAKLVGGGNTTAGAIGGGVAGATGGTSGFNPQKLASMLGSSLPTQAAPGGLYRMNENPFNFGTQGQTVANTNMYDVSGTNPMANQLRKKNYGIG
jgi:hypothetical protein